MKDNKTPGWEEELREKFRPKFNMSIFKDYNDPSRDGDIRISREATYASLVSFISSEFQKLKDEVEGKRNKLAQSKGHFNEMIPDSVSKEIDEEIDIRIKSYDDVLELIESRIKR